MCTSYVQYRTSTVIPGQVAAVHTPDRTPDAEYYSCIWRAVRIHDHDGGIHDRKSYSAVRVVHDGDFHQPRRSEFENRR